MPRHNRLTRADLARLSRTKGFRAHGRYFSVMTATLPGAGAAKCACVVSKKVSSRAVKRNAIERACREALRPLMSSLAPGAALVFYAKAQAADASSAELRADVGSLVERGLSRGTMLST